jgi:hypothetical protein
MELVHEGGKQIPKAIREPAIVPALHVADRLDDDHLVVDVELHRPSRADCFERGDGLSGVVATAELHEQRIARLPRDHDLGAGDGYEDAVHTTGPAESGMSLSLGSRLRHGQDEVQIDERYREGAVVEFLRTTAHAVS